MAEIIFFSPGNNREREREREREEEKVKREKGGK